MLTELPTPSSVALEHSGRLVARLHERIAMAGGWISFRDYMESALYEPGLGYYSAGATKFGAAGDFVTAPELSPLFSQCLAGQCAEVLATLGGGSVLELGAGSGRMAADMLLEFARLGVMPERYLILERSADLRERQAATLAALPDELHERVSWLDSLPTQPLQGVIIGNEVADALPVQRVVFEGGNNVLEQGVASDGNELALRARVADAELRSAVTALNVTFDAPYVTEICTALPPWIAALSDALAAGMLLLLDYGYNRAEYYLPERRSGTLRCYYRHRAHEDALLWPGLQDITAWVDFTTLAAAGVASGLKLGGYTTQAQFLLAAGIDGRVQQESFADPIAQVSAARGLRALLLPGEMGDAVKVIGLTRDAGAPSGFDGRDMRSQL